MMGQKKQPPCPVWLIVAIAATLTTMLLWYNLLMVSSLVAPPWPVRAQRLHRDASDYLQFVNPLIGTTGGGHVFAGASTPFGSVKVGADSKSAADSQPGFVDNGTPLYGFSQLHDDGTGGSSSLGQFALLPQLCSFQASLDERSGGCKLAREDRIVEQAKESIHATPGLFEISLENDIRVSLTSTDHTALHAYRLGKELYGGDKELNLLVDLTSDLQMSYSGQGMLTMSFDKRAATATLQGSGEFMPSFGVGTFKVHFCATIPHVSQAALFSEGTLQKNSTTLKNPPRDAGALLEIDIDAITKKSNGTLFARVGVSWKSQEQACHYQEQEISDFDSPANFNAIVSASRDKWAHYMGDNLGVELQGVSDDQRINFFSSLYRTGLAPTNISGDNPLYESTEPYWDSFYCIWDSFRTTSPLLAILQPTALAEQVRALIDVYRHLGFLPDCRMSLCKGYTQGGSNADTLLADAYVKGIRKGINWTDGLAAMRKDAEVDPEDWGVEGRGGIKARKRLGYVPLDADGNKPTGYRVVPGRTASRTLEYAYNDFGIATVAAGERDKEVYDQYIKASGDWFNLWDKHRSFISGKDNYTGFINARFANGTFSYAEDVRRCSPAYQFGKCYLGVDFQDAQFYEGSAYQYSFYVPHDMRKLVTLMGGDATFVERLEAGWNRNYNDVGDEMGFLPNFQHNYAVGGYRTSVDRSIKTLRKYFKNTSNGLPGNDDSGAMSAYVVFTGLGLYPVAGTSIYLLTTPLFPSYQVRSTLTGKIAKVTTEKWDEARTNKYIQKATLNGKAFTRNWLTHEEFFEKGGQLHLVLGPEPSGFGEKEDDLPPSLSTGAFTFDTAGKGF